MVIGYVLISVAPSQIKRIFKELSSIPEINELSALFGEYDIIAKIDATNVEQLAKIVIKKIRTIEGIVDTRTLRGVKI
jgi:DNA-binding Lrp family transcriptional regulator